MTGPGLLPVGDAAIGALPREGAAVGVAGRPEAGTEPLPVGRCSPTAGPPRARPALSPARLFGNFLLLVSGEGLAKLLTLVAFAYLARVLGPAEFGALEFALALMVFFILLVDGGLSPYGARELGKDPAQMATLVRHLVLTRLGLAVLACAALIALAAGLDQPWATRRLLLLYGLSLLVFPGSLSWAFQGRDLMGLVATGSSIRWGVFTAGVLLAVSGPEDTWVVPLVETAALGAMVAFYALAYRRRFGGAGQSFQWARAAAMLHDAFPIGGSELAWALRMYCATVLLGIVVGGAAVGWYGGAHRIVLGLHTFVWLYFFNVLPSVARASLGPATEVRTLMGRSLRISAWATVFLGVVGTVLAEPLVTGFYGPQYREAAPILRVLLWLVPLAAVSGHYRYVLIGCGHQRWELVSSVSGALVSLGLGLVLIPTLGVRGLAWALVASEATIWGLTYAFVRRRVTTIPVWTALWRPGLGGLGLAAALSWRPGTGALALAVAMVAVAGYWLAAALSERELRQGLRAALAVGR